MNKEKQGFSAFLLHFLERLNSDKTIEAKITESLTDICKYYGFKIVGFASLLVESDSKEERREYINIMQENTDLLLQLISDILDLSKIEAGTLEFTMDHLNVKSFCEDIMRNYDIKGGQGSTRSTCFQPSRLLHLYR